MYLRLLLWLLTPILLAITVTAQSATQWTDPLTNIPFWRYVDTSVDAGYGFIFPPLQPTSNEFIGIFTVPTGAGWAGVSLGGGMRSNLLIVGWLNGNTPVLSSRYVTAYAPPGAYSGPTLTVLGTSGLNGTHQRIVYRCQNCTTWTGGTGSLNLNGNPTLGFAVHGSIKPLDVANPSSELYRHTLAGQFVLNTANAHSSSYSSYLSQLQNAPPLGGGAGPTTTTQAPLPTSTVNTCPGAPQASYGMTSAQGWRHMPVLGRLSNPRGIAMDTLGQLLVVERRKGVTGHVLDANGCVTSSKTVIQDNGLNHGIDVHPAGNKLFASSSDVAWVWDYDPVAMTATNKRTLVTGMNNNGHSTRTILIPRKYPNLMVLTVGSEGNIDMPSFQMNNGRASIKVFEWATLPTNGVVYNSTSYGKVLGYGLRNDVGVAEDRAGLVYSIENSLDNAYRVINGQNRDIHINNPAEKVYRLGDPSNPRQLFGGYPHCYTVWEPSDFTDKQFAVGDWFVQNNSGQYNDDWCNTNATKPVALLPPHTAPLDMKFGLGTDSNMYAALHGSWNRQPPAGYKVTYTPGRFSASGEWSPTVDLAGTKGTYVDLFTNSRSEGQCSSGCFRPVGLVFSATGDNLYVSSDTSGEVFMLKRNAGPVTNPGSGPTSNPGQTSTTPTTTITTPTTTPTQPSGPLQTAYGQCGGQGWTGPTQCASGTCQMVNQWYSQCVP
ncbi:hypothetical protein EST38_g13592 [Candolleomyces aberdarensis]|uniref:CBM1 domain-containing protein n=1 Tax=Candolleomyces aberdarensis TaxID=2316362 RepID=A0A4Q2CZJ6_9AGAR|nr:hypothetical protein EST38_g13592 [Candolleomyces aberdarensis]